MWGRENAFINFPEVLNIPAGVTLPIASMPGQIGVVVKYVSGGSLSILPSPIPAGASFAGATFAVANLYTLGTNEVFNEALSGTLYLIATGATCVANLIRLSSVSPQ